MVYVVVAPELLAAAFKAPRYSPVGPVLALCAYSAALDKLEAATNPAIQGWDRDASLAEAAYDLLEGRLPADAPPDWTLVVPQQLGHAALDELTRTSHEHSVSTAAAHRALNDLLIGRVPGEELLVQAEARYRERRYGSAQPDPLLIAAHAALDTEESPADSHAVVVTERIPTAPAWLRTTQRHVRRFVRQLPHQEGRTLLATRSRVDTLTPGELSAAAGATRLDGFELDTIAPELFADVLRLTSGW